MEAGGLMYIGLWYGGKGYSQGTWKDDAEVFDSINHAKSELRARYAYARSYGTLAVEWHEDGTPVVGEPKDNESTEFWGVDTDCELILVPFESATLGNLEEWVGYASHKLTIGPRGGVNLTVL